MKNSYQKKMAPEKPLLVTLLTKFTSVVVPDRKLSTLDREGLDGWRNPHLYC